MQAHPLGGGNVTVNGLAAGESRTFIVGPKHFNWTDVVVNAGVDNEDVIDEKIESNNCARSTVDGYIIIVS